MKPTGKYAYSFDRERGYEGNYDSVEEALKAAKADKRNGTIGDLVSNKNTIYSDDEVYIGEVMEFVPWISAEIIIEILQNSAYNEAGEFSEDYLVCKIEDEKLLEKNLTEAFCAWAKETKNEPNFFTVENVKAYNL